MAARLRGAAITHIACPETGQTPFNSGESFNWPLVQLG